MAVVGRHLATLQATSWSVARLPLARLSAQNCRHHPITAVQCRLNFVTTKSSDHRAARQRAGNSHGATQGIQAPKDHRSINPAEDSVLRDPGVGASVTPAVLVVERDSLRSDLWRRDPHVLGCGCPPAPLSLRHNQQSNLHVVRSLSYLAYNASVCSADDPLLYCETELQRFSF